MKNLTRVVLLLCVLNSGAFGAVYWDNDSGNQRWEDANNWSGDAGPTVYPAIDIGTPNGVDECIIGSGVLANEPTKLWIGNNPGTEGSLVIDGGDLVCSQFLNIGYYGKGTCRLKSGTITTGLYDIEVAGTKDGSEGVLEIEGGTITAQRFFCVAEGVGSVATINMNGGLIEVLDYDFGKSTGLDLMRGATTVNLSGGTITTARDFYAGRGGTFTINMTGGTINAQTMYIGSDLTGASTTNALVICSGGVINVASLQINSLAASAKLDMRGGTVIIDGDVESAMNSYVSAGHIVAWDGLADVVVNYDTPNPGKTTIIAGEYAPYTARNLNPSGNSVSLDAVLTWTAGLGITQHRVYFSTDENEILNRLPVADHGYQNSGYDPGELVTNQTYYWCVDEVDSVTSQTYSGDVVSFTTTGVAEVRNHLGSPTLFVNSVPQIPMILFVNYGPTGWETRITEQVQKAAQAGFHIYSFDIGGMKWSMSGEQPIYQTFDKIANLIIQADPQAMLIPRMYFVSEWWWLEKYTGSRMLFSDSSTIDAASVASKYWRWGSLKNLRNFIRYCEQNYGNRVIGYHPSGQETGEWFYRRHAEPVHSGFEEPMRAGFAKWAIKKYCTLSKLREAWQAPTLTLESITVPTAAERENAIHGLFRDPLQEKRVIDFQEYQQVAMVEVLEQAAHVIKEETNGMKLALTFYGYHFELAAMPIGLSGSGHLALSRLLKCPDIDILCAPISYGNGRGTGGIGSFMVPVDSIRAAGKLWINEDDTRTYLSDVNEVPGRTPTLQETKWVHQRNFAHMLPRRLACWYMDLPGEGWLNSTDIWAYIADLKQIYAGKLNTPASWQPEVAVVIDEKSPLYLASNSTQGISTLTGPQLYFFREDFYRMGAPFGMYLLSDIMSGKIELPKVTFFLGCHNFTSQERTKITRSLNGKTAVWFYGSGYLDDTTASAINMEKLTGFSFSENTNGGSPVITFDNTSSLTQGVVGNTYGPSATFNPIWAIEDVAIERIAHYSDNTVAAARKNTNYFESIYIGSTGCPAKLIRNILKEAGVHVYVDSYDVLLTDGIFLSLTASSAGTKEIILPQGMQLRNIETNQILVPVNNIVSELFVHGQTKQYWIEPI